MLAGEKRDYPGQVDPTRKIYGNVMQGIFFGGADRTVGKKDGRITAAQLGNGLMQVDPSIDALGSR